VQEMLGHESLETTQIYLGLAKKVQRKMVQELALWDRWHTVAVAQSLSPWFLAVVVRL